MALFRKFFYRKPPDGLLEIAERVYVFDCCFTTDVAENQNYKSYIGGIVRQLQDHLPDASFMAFNFREGENQSQIGSILSEYDMTVIDYPRQYEGCPVLTLELIHHCLKSGDSWLLLGPNNVLLMHCELGGWPILAFMLAALLLYRKLYSGEQKTLDMIYRQAPRELLQLMSPLNPIPSQLRYLQYVSRRNLDLEWPPSDRGLKVDCLMLRLIPNIDGVGGCRPILRIYGRDPSPDADRAPIVLFSTPKKSKVVRQYKQKESELVKIDVNCHVQGDVVLECISLDDDLEREQIMFRVMFSTAFIRSNILMLTRDEIDTLWDDKDNFPKNFRAEVLFSDIDSETSETSYEMPVMEEKDGLPVEAFAKVQEIFNNIDWIDPKSDAALNVLQKISSSKLLKEKLEIASQKEKGSIESVRELIEDKFKSEVLEDGIKSSPLGSSEKLTKPSLETSSNSNLAGQETDISEGVLSILENQDTASLIESSKSTVLSPQKQHDKEITVAREKLTASESMLLEKPSKQSSDTPADVNVIPKKAHPQGLLPVLQQATQTKIISSRILQSSRSSSGIYSNSLQVSTKPIKRFHSSPSALGITALLHDHDTNSNGVSSLQGNSQQPLSSSVSFVPEGPKPEQLLSTTIPHQPAPAPPPPPPPPPLQSVNLDYPYVEPSMADKTSSPPAYASGLTSDPPESSDPMSSPSPLPSKHSGSQDSVVEKSVSTPALHPPLPIPSSSSESTLEPEKHYNAFHLERLPSGKSKPSLHLPPPPPLPPPLGTSIVADTPLSPPSLPQFERPTFQNPGSALSAPPPPPPLPPSSRQSPPSTTSVPSAPPPPPPPPKQSQSKPNAGSSLSSPHLPPPPPPPPPPPYIHHLPENVSSATGSDLSTSSSLKVAKAPPPPPPPTLPVSAARRNLASSVPPPPPPPIGSYLQVGPTNSSKGPPVPPPPTPPGKGPQKANGSAQTSQVGGNNGPFPPPPGPPGKGRAPPRLTPRNQGQLKKNNLKPYHWLKLTRVVQGSLWAEAQKPEEASKAPEFDMSELETLFAASVPNAEKGAAGGQSRSRASGPKTDKVQLIDLRRAYNCEIMLTKVKVPLPDLTNAVLALDDSALDIDQVENLIKFCPTKEEMELLKGYTGDKENLGKCEQFFLELMKVPRVESKLRVFCFKIQFKTQVSDLRKNLQIVNSASEEIRSSVKLKRVMQTILSLGNALNQGTARGAAVGFRLDSLLKLTDTRSRNNKMTLMHYLCKVLAEKLPDVLDFPKDLVNLEGSSKIQLKILAEEMQAISKGLEKVVQELSASGNDGPVSDNFRKILKEFLSYAEGEVRSLATLYSFVGRNADALAQYFGEDPAKVPFEQVVMTLQNFVKMFHKAHEENCKQLEMEKKKAEKEAKNEKSKTTTEARAKNSEHTVQSPHKIGTVN